ncbi:MAG: hypothetical protein V4858_10055 [Pseudomonadota bacterium]
MKPQYRAQTGFAAIAAIVIVVLLAALGGFMVSISNTQQLSSSQDVQGSRAYWAARAGLEWAVVAIPDAPALCPNAALTQVAVASVPSPIEGFAIQVRCSKTTHAEGAATPTIYQFESQASIGTMGAIGFIERSVTASLEQ